MRAFVKEILNRSWSCGLNELRFSRRHRDSPVTEIQYRHFCARTDERGIKELRKNTETILRNLNHSTVLHPNLGGTADA